MRHCKVGHHQRGTIVTFAEAVLKQGPRQRVGKCTCQDWEACQKGVMCAHAYVICSRRMPTAHALVKSLSKAFGLASLARVDSRCVCMGTSYKELGCSPTEKMKKKKNLRITGIKCVVVFINVAIGGDASKVHSIPPIEGRGY